MEIKLITEHKEDYFEWLLLADEQKELVEAYLYQGDMWALEEEGVKTVSIVIFKDRQTCELKNLVTLPSHQGHGYGNKMIQFLFSYYHSSYQYMEVGTGDSPKTIPFYEKCGFKRDHIIPNFFLDHYDHPIIEDGVLLKDMIYLKKEL
ncbi:MAG: GNAT family N-acetyltransferase [Beduini sp.]|uniref:GNAT family N-acetyltransferase n=1 Tax=Beduini sp. TaxID=1922300 RepID=UPI00399F8CA5